MEKPFISVIVTAYNRKQFILEALNSIVNQTLSKDKYEVIVTKNVEGGGQMILYQKTK